MSDASARSQTVTREVVIRHALGIHARPAAMLVKAASRYNSDVFIEKGGSRVSGKSIMGLLTLEAYKGDTLRLIASGDDATDAIAELATLVEKSFYLDDDGAERGQDVR